MGKKLAEALDRAQRAAYESQRRSASPVTKALNSSWLDEVFSDSKTEQKRK